MTSVGRTAPTAFPARGAWRDLRGLGARIADGGFDLPQSELAEVNRWLTFKSCLTCAIIVVFCTILKVAALPDLGLGLIVALCAFDVVMSLVVFRGWGATGRALGLLIYAQYTLDVLLITIAFATLPELPVMLHLQYLMVIIPCALLSRLCGGIMAGLAIAAHLLLVRMHGGVSAFDVIAPVYFFAVLAHQCFYWGRRHAEKARQAAHESHVAAQLLRVARELAAAPSHASVLTRLVDLTQELAHASWVSISLRDPTSDEYVVRGLVTRRGEIDDEVLSLTYPAEPAAHACVLAAPDGCIEVRHVEDSIVPRALHERWRLGPYFAVLLRRGGESVGLLCAGQDDPATAFLPVTRRVLVGMAHQAVLALENARLVDDLRDASALKSEFIGTISHELRSPLHAILGYNDMLRDEAAADAVAAVDARQDMLGRVRRHALQLLETIEATLNVGRLESGRLPVRMATVPLGELFAGLRAELPDFWFRPTVTFDWCVPDAMPVVETDPGKLKMIVRNLVHNALKFTEAGCVKASIGLDLPARNGHGESADDVRLRIVVADTGIGIPPEMQHAVFDMFRQVDGSFTRRHDGVGLGLYIVRRLVDVLGGTIRFESRPGQGTQFEVMIPVRPPVVADAAARGLLPSAL